jgi:hypothetical protein
VIRRLLWLGVGIGVGVVVVRVITKKARAFTPAGMVDSASAGIGSAAGSIRGLLDDVLDGMHEREDEIRGAFEDGIALDSPDLPWAYGVGHRFGKFKSQLEGE